MADAEYAVEGEHTFAAEWEQNASNDEKNDSDEPTNDSKPIIPVTGDDMGMVVIPLFVAVGVALVALVGAAVKRRKA